MKITIEKNIPLINNRISKNDMTEVLSMENGDSFLYPIKKRFTLLKHIANTIKEKELDWEFTTRSIKGDNDNIRVWRIK